MTEGVFDLDRIGGVRAMRALVDEVLAAGEEGLRFYRSGVATRVEDKLDNSPVTEADRAIEARLQAFCAQRFPSVGFLGEEGSATKDAGSGLRFAVDPIDGTRAFIRGIPTWSVLVGLEEHSVPVLGIAYMPAAGELFVGARGHGVEGNGRPLRVSEIATLDKALVCHGALSQFTESGTEDMLPRLARGTYTQRGFSDFDGYRNILLGRAEAMIDPGIKPWDVCAPALLVCEAGGRFTTLDGEESIFGNGAVASNGKIHGALLALLRG